MTLRNGYARTVTERLETNEFRFMTVGEAKELEYGDRVPFLALDGTQREIKINGTPKVWKRSPGVTVSLKYGLYEYTTVGSKHMAEEEAVGLLLVRLF